VCVFKMCAEKIRWFGKYKTLREIDW